MCMEQWKDIIGFPDYQVSNLGRVRRFNSPKRSDPEIYLKSRTQNSGYSLVHLYPKAGQRVGKTVHRLVAEAFLPPTVGAEVDHINRDKTDNRVENLRWATRSEQCLNRDYPSSSGHRNITARKDGYFSVKIHRGDKAFYKTTKTLQEAIEARDKILLDLTRV